jgi:hypothetical protein
MKPYVCVVFATCLYASVAFGQDTHGSTSTIGEFACGISGTPIVTETQNAEQITSNEVIFTTSVVDGDGTLRPTRFSVRIPVSCDGPHTLSVGTIRGGLVETGDVTSNQFRPTRHIDYRATLSWANQRSVLFTNATPGKSSLPIRAGTPIHATADLLVEVDPTTKDQNIPTVQGKYNDIVTITIGPML